MATKDSVTPVPVISDPIVLRNIHSKQAEPVKKVNNVMGFISEHKIIVVTFCVIILVLILIIIWLVITNQRAVPVVRAAPRHQPRQRVVHRPAVYSRPQPRTSNPVSQNEPLTKNEEPPKIEELPEKIEELPEKIEDDTDLKEVSEFIDEAEDLLKED